MTKLTETQALILSAGAQRPANIALPLPKRLAGAAAKKAVNRMIALGWLQEVDANIRRREPLWRETGDGHGTTLVVTGAGLLAIGIEPVVVKTTAAIREHAAKVASPKRSTQRAGTKQAMLIALLQTPEGATIAEIVAITGWMAHSARGVISGVLKGQLCQTKNTRRFNDFPASGFRWLASGVVASANWIPWIPQRIQRAKVVIQQAFDNESLFPRSTDKWIPPGFPGETACR